MESVSYARLEDDDPRIETFRSILALADGKEINEFMLSMANALAYIFLVTHQGPAEIAGFMKEFEEQTRNCIDINLARGNKLQ
jgi:hypothetical protein